MESTNASLLGQVKQRSNAAWVDFYGRYSGLVIRYAMARGVSAVDAEDVLQLVFLKLFRVFPRFGYDRSKGRFRDYMRRVVASAIAERQGKRSGCGALPCDQRGAMRSVLHGVPVLDLGVDPTSEDDAAWEREWIDHHLRRALSALRSNHSPRALEIFRALLEGASTEAAASLFGMSVEAIRKVRQRLLAEVRAQIVAQIEGEG